MIKLPAMKDALFLAVDAGTTALKAAIFDHHGRCLAIDHVEYSLLTPAPAWVELDAETYWNACCQAVRNVVLRCGHSNIEIVTLCISSQGETLIPADTNGIPTRRTIVWLDNRAGEEAAMLADHFGRRIVYLHTGQPEVVPTWPACKILWLRRHEPEVFAKSVHYFLLEDYLLYRMTGQFVTERALQTSSLFLDIRSRTWWPEIFDFTGITPQHWGRLMNPGERLGTLSAEGAADLGLTTATVAITGGLDQTLGAVGAGNINPGVVSETTGGALAVLATTTEPSADLERPVPCHIHAASGKYCLLLWAQTAGMAFKWWRDEFFSREKEEGLVQGGDVYEIMTEQAGRVAPGSEGLIVLPHLEGAFCPEFNPQARAVFFGATLRHGRAHFTRALMESIAFVLKSHLDLLHEIGIEFSEIRSLGGGARSRLWLQIKADVLQMPLRAVEVEEAALLGAAVMGATAHGLYATIEEGTAAMVHLQEPILPRQEYAAVYRRDYARYRELYNRLEPMFINGPE